VCLCGALANTLAVERLHDRALRVVTSDYWVTQPVLQNVSEEALAQAQAGAQAAALAASAESAHAAGAFGRFDAAPAAAEPHARPVPRRKF
jgi:hypothetical protein